MSLTYNARVKCIAPEKFRVAVWHAFSINLKELKGKTIAKRVFEYMTVLAKLKYCDYDLMFELSAVGKLHMHGMIKVNTMSSLAKFFAYDMCVLTTDAAIEIDTIGNGEDDLKKPSKKILGEDHQEDDPEKSDKSRWDTYCTKSKVYMHDFLKEENLPWRLTNGYVDMVINNKNTPELKRFFQLA